MSIKDLLTKILRRMNMAPIYNSGSKTVNASGNYDLASITLPANCKYVVLASTVEGVASSITSICQISVSGASYTFGNGSCRTNASSGQGVMSWMYVQTGSSSATATVQCYGYYTTSHTGSGWIIGIPVAGGGTV